MAAASSCLSLWRAENDGLAGRWRRGSAPRGEEGLMAAALEDQAAHECPRAFQRLLQKIQGLPAVLPALPLELTILCNSLLLDMALSRDSSEKLVARIDCGLRRVLEARAVPGEGLSSEGLWQKAIQQEIPEELQGPLHQLAALQGLLWLAGNHLGALKGLWQQLQGAKGPGLPLHRSGENELLSLLQGWHPADPGESDPLVLQSSRDLKDVLWTSAAFLQGFQELDAGKPATALASLQAAATGLCPKRVLAQVFTLMGCCNLKMGKPQTAIQCLKQALQVDSSFLPALYQAALLYRQLGLVEAELEALALLDQALDGSTQMAPASLDPPSFVGVELLICTPRVCAFFGQNSPSEVKYLLAQRCLQEGRAKEAAELYLDLLALWQEGPLHQGILRGGLALPRVPEVFLEAASALEEVARHQEAIAVCEEVVSQTSRLVPKKLQIDVGSSASEDSREVEREREGLRCTLWRATAYLLQGCAQAKLGEAKEAVSLSSRCLQDLLRIQFVNTGSQGTEEDVGPFAPTEAKRLPQIRQLALTVRGVEFLELGREKEALMDFQHSLRFGPGSPAAHWYLLHTLWKLGRRREARAHWYKFRTNPGLMEEEEAKRPSPQYLRLCMKWMRFPHVESLAKDLESSSEESGQEP
ncbi:Fanconi anemia group G protein [Heteronotia binoei]|uniref:Fanconi anemia group G protein n=1 Tax=Heteronotia binoei TaxID=13085 RepID=UPI00292D119B|nr:Fanconi anemia group G protein [Heteronotia binoei]